MKVFHKRRRRRKGYIGEIMVNSRLEEVKSVTEWSYCMRARGDKKYTWWGYINPRYEEVKITVIWEKIHFGVCSTKKERSYQSVTPFLFLCVCVTWRGTAANFRTGRIRKCSASDHLPWEIDQTSLNGRLPVWLEP